MYSFPHSLTKQQCHSHSNTQSNDPTIEQLTGTNICDDGITSLLAYSWSHLLQRIDASHCEAITNIGISVIATRCATSLQTIQLSRCTGVSDDGIAILAQHCPRLRYVDVRRLKNLTDRGARYLVARTYYELETLILKRCSKITDATFEVLEPGFEVASLLHDKESASPKSLEIKLAHLDIAQCRNLTDVTLKRVSRCKRLDTIKVESLDRITDEGFFNISSCCPLLRVVDLMSVHNVTFKSIANLVHNCSGLTDLNLVSIGLTDDVLKDMAKSCTGLEVLSIAPRRNEHLISDRGVLEIAKRCSRLRELHIGRVDLTDEGLKTLGVLTDLNHIEIFKCEMISESGTADLIRSSKSSLSRVNIWNNPKLDHDIKSLEAGLDLIRHVNTKSGDLKDDDEIDDDDEPAFASSTKRRETTSSKKGRRFSSPGTIANALKSFFGGKKRS